MVNGDRIRDAVTVALGSAAGSRVLTSPRSAGSLTNGKWCRSPPQPLNATVSMKVVSVSALML